MTTSEAFAAQIFRKAISEQRAGELLDALLEGGSATLDAVTGQLVIYPAAMVEQMGGES